MLVVLLASVGWSTTASAHASGCARPGERVVASSPRLTLLAPRAHGVRARDARTVCVRASGARRSLASLVAACSHCAARIKAVVLRGRVAYVIVSRRAYNDQESELATLDAQTGRVRRVQLVLGDQSDDRRSDVTDVVALSGGRAALRVRNDFAAGIVVAGPDGTTWLDEGLATAVGRPRVRAGRVVWRHGATLASAPARIVDRCPRPPAAPAGGRVLATADAIASGTWFCLRATGSVGRLDGSVGRLLGPLAVVQRPADVRVVDLRTTTTLSGPAASDPQARGATVGRSGTLVLRRFGACAGEAEIVAFTPGAPERRIACGDLRDVRYVDGVLRYRDQATDAVVTTSLP